MKYYILETSMKPGAYKAPNFKQALAGHMEFVKSQFMAGIVLFSGTKPNNSGGVRVIKTADTDDVDSFWQLDPMAAAGLLEYRVQPFSALDVSDSAKIWFDSET